MALTSQDIAIIIKAHDSASETFNQIHQNAEKSSKGITDAFGGISHGIGGLLRDLATLHLAFLGIGDVTAPLRAVWDQFNQGEAAAKQTEAVLKSTGHAAGVTAEQVSQLASALQKTTTYQDDQVQSATNVLLTFQNIGGRILPQTTQAVLDFATAMHMDTKSAALDVGKALQDPILGMTTLRREGVAFTETQQEVIKHLVETGQGAKAQDMILKELAAEFGGSASKAAETFGGKLTQLKNEALAGLADQFKEHIAPRLSEFVDLVTTKIIPAVEHWAKTDLVPWLHDVHAFIDQKVVPVLTTMWEWIQNKVVVAITTMWDWIQNKLIPALQNFWQNDVLPKLTEFVDLLQTRVLPALRDLWDWIQAKVLPKVQELIQFISDHKEIIAAFAIAVGLVTAAWIVYTVATAAAAIATATIFAPVTLVVGAIALLVLGVIEAKKHWDEIKQVWEEHRVAIAVLLAPFGLLAAGLAAIGIAVQETIRHWDDLKTAATTAAQWVQDKFAVTKKWFEDEWAKLEGLLKAPLEAVGKVAQGLWDAVGDPLLSGAKGLLKWFDDNFKIKEKIENPLRDLAKSVGGIWDEIGAAIMKSLNALPDPVKGALGKIGINLDSGARGGYLGPLHGSQELPGVIAGEALGPIIPSANATTRGTFANSLWPVAVAYGQKYGIPPEVLVAMNINEGYGAGGNELFGIKGPGMVAQTWEGNQGTIADSFRTYPNVNAAYTDFFKLLNSSPGYSAALQKLQAGKIDTAEFLSELGDAGYFTADQQYGRGYYANAILGIAQNQVLPAVAPNLTAGAGDMHFDDALGGSTPIGITPKPVAPAGTPAMSGKGADNFNTGKSADPLKAETRDETARTTALDALRDSTVAYQKALNGIKEDQPKVTQALIDSEKAMRPAKVDEMAKAYEAYQTAAKNLLADSEAGASATVLGKDRADLAAAAKPFADAATAVTDIDKKLNADEKELHANRVAALNDLGDAIKTALKAQAQAELDAATQSISDRKEAMAAQITAAKKAYDHQNEVMQAALDHDLQVEQDALAKRHQAIKDGLANDYNAIKDGLADQLSARKQAIADAERLAEDAIKASSKAQIQGIQDQIDAPAKAAREALKTLDQAIAGGGAGKADLEAYNAVARAAGLGSSSVNLADAARAKDELARMAEEDRKAGLQKQIQAIKDAEGPLLDAVKKQFDAQTKAVEKAAKERSEFEATEYKKRTEAADEANKKESEHLATAYADRKKNAAAYFQGLKDEADAYEKYFNKEVLDPELKAAQQHYKDQTNAYTLEAHARQLIESGNQREIVNLLKTFNPDWQAAGRDLGTSMIDGIKAADIPGSVAKIFKDVFGKDVGPVVLQELRGGPRTASNGALGGGNPYAVGTPEPPRGDIQPGKPPLPAGVGNTSVTFAAGAVTVNVPDTNASPEAIAQAVSTALQAAFSEQAGRGAFLAGAAR